MPMIAATGATSSIFKKGRKFVFMVLSPAETYFVFYEVLGRTVEFVYGASQWEPGLVTLRAGGLIPVARQYPGARKFVESYKQSARSGIARARASAVRYWARSCGLFDGGSGGPGGGARLLGASCIVTGSMVHQYIFTMRDPADPRTIARAGPEALTRPGGDPGADRPGAWRGNQAPEGGGQAPARPRRCRSHAPWPSPSGHPPAAAGSTAGHVKASRAKRRARATPPMSRHGAAADPQAGPPAPEREGSAGHRARGADHGNLATGAGAPTRRGRR